MTAVTELDNHTARQLTDRIKAAVDDMWLLIQEAYTSRAWAALSYANWDAYCASEFGTARLRLPREERQEVVASLRESGLSLRAIESATGISRKTIIKDTRAAVVESTPPDQQSVVGTDGRVYGPPGIPSTAGDELVEPDSREPSPTLTERSPMKTATSPKTIGPPITDSRGRLMPQRAQRKAIADGIAAISGLCSGFARLEEIDDSINAEEAEQWVRDLSESLRVLRKFTNKLKEHNNAEH